ncbi:MAG: helix-turn-helix domain-containing protein [Lachnospiraceae bacterium]|nr:helix-turn-helix domain-containing protein [Lachnospiraceae bacterium]
MSIEKEWHLQELQENEQEKRHRPIEEEYSFYHAVKNGDMNFVRENCQKGDFSNPEGVGVLSKNPLTNLKYHFVITVAMITRHCVDGGMELEKAYRLSDFYISRMDSCTTVAEVTALHDNMVLDFTGKMLQLQKDAVISKPVVQCMDYIYSHIHERITVQDLAAHTDRSASYLSRVFKNELGISISDYIREKKLEKAQNLLRYSDYSFIEIANYLAFSSQSHFIQLFEKYYGITPRQYRNKYYHENW